jgi:phosphatidylserine/phosphatidylglycerophosphate/cardiolipin synthase-like enzyme
MVLTRLIFLFSLLIITGSALCQISAIVYPCFTPGDRCDLQLIDVIGDAQNEIDVQAYQLTSRPISDALAIAKQRGVIVKIILDKTQARQKGYSPVIFFHNMQIPVWIDNKVAIAHNKVMIIDDDLVVTGSYNFSRAAQYRNAENMVFIKSKEIARKYLINFNSRLKVSEKL